MLTVMIPAYQPDEALVDLTDELWSYGCRMIVVDDGSGASYEPVFRQIKDICTVLTHPENKGKGAAIKTALTYIQQELPEEDLIGVMDADGQHLPEDMMRLFAYAGAHRKTMVLGVRQVGKDMPLRSRLGNQITRTVFQLVSGVKVSDTQTGLRAFDSELIPQLLAIDGVRYEYEMNVLIALAKGGFPIEEVPIHTIYRDQENSTSHFRAVRDSLRIYRDIFKFTLSSLSSFLLEYLLFSLLMLILPHTALPVLAANVLARCVSAFYNYSMNCRFVFHTKKTFNTAVNYFELALGILLMNNLILGLLVEKLHMVVYPAKLCTELFLFLISWLIQNCVIFRKQKDIPHEGSGAQACGSIPAAEPSEDRAGKQDHSSRSRRFHFFRYRHKAVMVHPATKAAMPMTT